MTNVYSNNQDQGNFIADREQLANQNGVIDITSIPRDELSTLNAIAQEFKVWRQQFEGVVTQMRQASDIDTLLKVTVAQVREKIVCDRALIYSFTSYESGTVLAESKTLGWTPALNQNLPGNVFGLYETKDYLESVEIDDINKIQLTPYQKQLLDKFQIKAILSLPIFVEDKIWGLLVVNNCASIRQWQEVEITLLSQIATELTYRLQSFKIQNELQHVTLGKQISY